MEPTKRDLNILALLFLGIGCAIGAYLLFWKGSSNGYIWMGIGVVLCVARLIPPLFRTIYRFWVGLSVVLGYFISRIILTVLFFVVVMPIGFVMRLVGKDPMERKLDPDAPTYWKPREPEADTSIERYEKQF